MASPSAYFGAQDDFAREERLRGELDAKAAKAEAMRAQVAQGEQTKEMGVKRLEELSQKSTELDRILADMQQQLADQETAKSDILREYQVRDPISLAIRVIRDMRSGCHCLVMVDDESDQPPSHRAARYADNILAFY